jgi:hypothetical protein
MRTFAIEGDSYAPSILIDEEKSLVEISGYSTLKETNWFYSNLLKWLIAFNTGNSKTETINIRLKRINDSSTKWLTLIFKKLVSLLPSARFEINWYMESRNQRVLASGKSFQQLSGLNVNLIGC